MKHFFLFCGWMVLSIFCHAQKSSISLSVPLAIPQGAYNQNMNGIGAGLDLTYQHILQDSKLHLGLEFAFLSMESEHHSVNDYYQDYYKEYEVGGSSMIYTIAANFRYDLYESKAVKLFSTATIGTNDHYYNKYISHDNPDYWIWAFSDYYYSSMSVTDWSKTHNSWTFMAVAGFGADFTIFRNKTSALFTSVDYRYGSTATYFTDIRTVGFEVYATPHNSLTNMFLVQFGIRAGLSFPAKTTNPENIKQFE
jgi:hypothetical protein